MSQTAAGRCLVIRECRSIAPQTRAQRRQDSPRPARDSAVSSVGPSAAGPASLSTSPLDRLHLWSLGTDTEDFATLGRALFQEGLTCRTVTGGTLRHALCSGSWSATFASLQLFPCAESRAGLGGWDETRGVTVIREPLDGPCFFGDCHLPGQMAARADPPRVAPRSSPHLLPVA